MKFLDVEAKNWKGMMTKLRYSKELQEKVKQATKFLDGYDDVTISERVWYIKEGLHEVQLCPYCSKKKRKFKKLDKGLAPTCGDEECKKAGMSKGALAPRDWDAIQAKMKATYKARTGYDHNTHNPAYIAKRKEESIKKYGVDCIFKKKDVIETREKTFKEKYGSQAEMFKQNIIKTYGSWQGHAKAVGEKRVATLKNTLFEQIKSKAKDLGFAVLTNDPNVGSYDEIELQCDRCGHVFHVVRDLVNHKWLEKQPFCPKCDFKDMTFRSNKEKELAAEIEKMHDGEIQLNRHVGKWEADIKVIDKKIAIDFNGLYWHSDEHKDKNYHQQKKIDIENEGWSFIQIWEDDWDNLKKRSIILSRLKSKLGLCEKIGARKCDVKEVCGKVAKAFLEENHLHGWVASSLNIGLFYNDELIEIATFGKSRKLVSGTDKEIELLRLCTKKDLEVVGGFSKILSYANKHEGVKKVMSYVDLDWSSSVKTGYEQVGFKKVKMTTPGYVWERDGIRYNRMNFTKKKLVEKYGCPESMTEDAWMKSHKYKKIWGSGNLLMEWIKD